MFTFWVALAQIASFGGKNAYAYITYVRNYVHVRRTYAHIIDINDL